LIIFKGYLNFALVARSKDLLEQTSKECQKLCKGKPKIITLPTDLSLEKECKSAVDQTVKAFGSKTT